MNINNAPRWFKALLLFAPVLGLFLINAQLNNDFYFLYPTGEYIVHNGFPTTDFLSMHTSMSIVVQQWLTAVVFYFVYSCLGQAGMVALLYICYVLTCALVYRLSFLISENFFVSAVCAFVCGAFMAPMYIQTRPQIFTYLILLTALCLLEKSAKFGSAKPLFAIVPLSVLLINTHAAMWVMLFVLAAPFVAAALPVKLGKFRQEPVGKLWALLAAGALSACAGFLNPYGVRSMLYMFSTVGHPYINRMIGEMAPFYMQGSSLVILALLLAFMLFLALKSKQKNYTTRFVLLFFGTLLLALINFRSYALFFIAGIPAFSYCVKDLQVLLPVSEQKEKGGGKGKKALLAAVLVCLTVVCIFAVVDSRQSDDAVDATEAQQPYLVYGAIDELCKILEPQKDNLVLYTGYDYGAYMEFKGYHPFLDVRAELFVKRNNHEADYIKEYYDVVTGRLDYKTFLEKYGFNYLVVSMSEGSLYEGLLADDDYELVSQEQTMCLFKLKNA